MEPQFQQVAIIGLGLIGGSVALGLKTRGIAAHVTAFDSRPEALQMGLDRRLIDAIATSPAAAAMGADLVILAVPVLSMEPIFRQLKPFMADPDRIVTDVGSVKCSVWEAARSALGEYPVNLVPGHPIAGSEQHGVAAADGDLFAHHKVILTPKLSTRGAATRRVREMWQAMDADVVEMEPEHHDTILAQTSHLPHLLAYALVDTLSAQGDSLEIFQYAAGGFRDFSRIAASDPIMWRDIFASNQQPVLEILDRYIEDLLQLRAMIHDRRSDDLAKVFARAKAARDHFASLTAERESRIRKTP